MIPIFHQLAQVVNYVHLDQVPFPLVMQSTRQVNDAHNSQLQSAGACWFVTLTFANVFHTHLGIPSCRWMRHVKEVWSLEAAARVSATPAERTLSSALACISATFANHKPKTGAHHYGLATETVVAVSCLLIRDFLLLLLCIVGQAYKALCDEYHRWVLDTPVAEYNDEGQHFVDDEVDGIADDWDCVADDSPFNRFEHKAFR